MKKFLMLVVVSLILMSCATAPSSDGPLGKWRKIDGELILTMEKRKFNFIDIENGYAGYGTYKIRGAGIEFTYENVLVLYQTTAAPGYKKFQREALAEFQKRYPEKLQALKNKLASEGLKESAQYLKGISFNEFYIEGNSLIMEGYQQEGTFELWRRFNRNFSGRFIKR